MKAFIVPKYGLPNVLKLVDVPVPKPKDDEVLVKVMATTINDWDLGLVQGSPFVIRLLYGFKKPKVNIPGTEISGIVEAVGKGVGDLIIGDMVYGDISESGFGGFAEYVCVKAGVLTKKPPVMSFQQAAAIPHAAELAYQGLVNLGKLKSGQKVLINGAGGGVGTIGVQIAKEQKIEITAVDHGSKLGLLKSIGYDHVTDYSKVDFTRGKEIYDLILDTKSNRPISHYARVLTKQGRYVTVGGQMRRILGITFLAPLIHMFTSKRFKVLSLKPNANLEVMNDLFEQGKMQPLIEGPFPFEHIPRLLEHFRQGKHKGKIVIEVS